MLETLIDTALQELIAPENGVIFCDQEWKIVGHTCRRSCLGQPCKSRFGSCRTAKVAEVTGIPRRSLVNFDPLSTEDCIAQRMAWASKRKTSRIEDEAYCLLGIFDVNMALIYGEGFKAFLRLQREIIQKSLDQSIFAWELDASLTAPNLGCSIFAMSPAWFSNSKGVKYLPLQHAQLTTNEDESNQPFAITNKGLELKASLERTKEDPAAGTSYEDSVFLLELNCVWSDEYLQGPIKIYLHETRLGVFHRARPKKMIIDDESLRMNRAKRARQKNLEKTIYIGIDNAQTPLHR